MTRNVQNHVFMYWSRMNTLITWIIIHMRGDHAKYDLDQAKIFLHIRRGLRHKIEQFWLENFPRSLQSDLFLFNRTYATPTFEWTAFHFVTSRAARAATERSICEGKYQERSICEGSTNNSMRRTCKRLTCTYHGTLRSPRFATPYLEHPGSRKLYFMYTI